MHRPIFAVIAVVGTICGACSDDDDGGSGSEYDLILAPSDNDQEAIQTAFEEAKSGWVIGLSPGTYQIDRELNLTAASDVTLKGMGASRDEVILDFAHQMEGDDGITVTAPGFTIENVWIKNSVGNGVVAHAEDSTFRNIKVTWDAGSVQANGAYAVYPTDCKRVLIDDVEVSGASDAGIYVGSCEQAIVRNSKVYGNVAGLEIENTLHADVYGNEVYDNTAGILPLLLPNLRIKDNAYVLLRDNEIHDNNRDNYARSGTVVASVPKGLGILVLAGHDIEIRDNDIHGNVNTGVLVVSYHILEILTGTTLDDEALDPFLKRVYVHDNTFADNGQAPTGAMQLVGQATLENVLWDGILDAEGTNAEVCLGTSPASFRNFNANANFADQSTDTAGHTCTLPALEEMDSFE